jgi:putative transposase
MPRRPRVIVPGVAHHVTQRGNNRRSVFLSRHDRTFYLARLTHNAALHGTRILGYCLMTNHVHLVAIPAEENSLARTLGPTHSEYALYRNRACEQSGHVWQNRFFSCPLGESHLITALRYIELNPVRAGLAELAWEWPWSSARAHAFPGSIDPVLDPASPECRGPWNHTEWREILAAGVSDTDSYAIRRATLTGEPLGSAEFVARLERETGRRLRVLARGRPRLPQESISIDSAAAAQACFFAGKD